MNRFSLYVLFGLLYVSVPEFTNLVVINSSPKGFVGALILYLIIFTAEYYIGRLLERIVTSRSHFVLVCVLLFGIAGLLFEWFAIGHGPGSGAIQLGMFVYWAGIFMVPWILSDMRKENTLLRDVFTKVFIVYLLVHAILTFALPDYTLPLLIPLLWTVVYTFFFIPYYKYAGQVTDSETDRT